MHRRTRTTAFLLSCVVLWLFLALVPLHLWHNPVLLYTWFILGAAAVPATLFWVMIHRLRTTDTVSALDLVLAAVLGGTLAAILGGTLDSVVALIPQGADEMVSLSLAGFVEEFAKGLLIVAVGWRMVKSTRNGLFVGGAVGLGFAVLETVGYIGEHFMSTQSLAAAGMVTLDRGLLAPFCHVLWSALVGAALFSAASRTGRFRLTWTVVGAYVGAAVLHGMWDGSGPIALQLTGDALLGNLASAAGMIVSALIGGLIWRHVVRRHPAPGVTAGRSDEAGPAAGASVAASAPEPTAVTDSDPDPSAPDDSPPVPAVPVSAGVGG